MRHRFIRILDGKEIEVEADTPEEARAKLIRPWRWLLADAMKPRKKD